MGKDIHILIEINNGSWKPVDEIPESYNCRNYDFFRILEEEGDVGIPEELKDKKFRYNAKWECWEFDFTDEYLFHHGYITLSQLKIYIKSMNKVTVSSEFLDKFFELGGELPDGMSIDEADDDCIFIEVEDEWDRATKSLLKQGVYEMEDIAEKYKVKDDEIRLVFAFDW